MTFDVRSVIKRNYSTELSDAEWECLEPYILALQEEKMHSKRRNIDPEQWNTDKGQKNVDKATQ